MRKLQIIALYIALIFSMDAFSASYDCNSKKLNDIEVIICEDYKLSSLDRILNSQYKSMTDGNTNIVLESNPDSELKRTQLNWIKQRNTCKNKACLEKAYLERMLLLSEKMGFYRKIFSKKYVTDLFLKETKIEGLYSEDTNIIRRTLNRKKQRVDYLVSFYTRGFSGSSGCGAANDRYISFLSVDIKSNKIIRNRMIASGGCTSYSLYIDEINRTVTVGILDDMKRKKIPAFKVKTNLDKTSQYYHKLNNEELNLGGWEKYHTY